MNYVYIYIYMFGQIFFFFYFEKFRIIIAGCLIIPGWFSMVRKFHEKEKVAQCRYLTKSRRNTIALSVRMRYNGAILGRNLVDRPRPALDQTLFTGGEFSGSNPSFPFSLFRPLCGKSTGIQSHGPSSAAFFLPRIANSDQNTPSAQMPLMEQKKKKKGGREC